jgi:hypothetical protein
MTSQFYIFNMTNDCMTLKHDEMKWVVGRESTYSWALPIDADCVFKYKVKHHDHKIATVWINHLGIIKGIKNHSKKFYVMTYDEIKLLRNKPHVCHIYGPPILFITEECHPHHHDHHHCH